MRPVVAAIDREAGSAVTLDLGIDDVLKDRLGEHDVGKECIGREFREALVSVAVAGDLVAYGRDPPDQLREAFRDPAKREEGRARTGVIERLQDPVDVTLDAARRRVPLGLRDMG